MTNERATDDASLEGPDVETTDDAVSNGINDQTGEYGPGVDQDTGADVGDTGKPELSETDTQREIDDDIASEESAVE